jgi:streptogramin lyase
MIKPYDKHDIVHIGGVDHPESISVGPKGEAYTTGTGCQVYRVDRDERSTGQVRGGTLLDTTSRPSNCMNHTLERV